LKIEKFGNMARIRPQGRKNFTVQEANATLPLVRAIAEDLVRLSREVIERRERLSVLLGGSPRSPNDPYREELAQIEEELEKDRRHLREFVEELRQLGVEARSVTEGLIDFPAMLEGRQVYLCWKLGEPEVLYWHEPGGDLNSRQPLAAGSVAEDGLPANGTNSAHS